MNGVGNGWHQTPCFRGYLHGGCSSTLEIFWACGGHALGHGTAISSRLLCFIAVVQATSCPKMRQKWVLVGSPKRHTNGAMGMFRHLHKILQFTALYDRFSIGYGEIQALDLAFSDMWTTSTSKRSSRHVQVAD